MKINLMFMLLLFLIGYSCSTDHEKSSRKLKDIVAFNDNWTFLPDSLHVGINQQWQNKFPPGSKIIQVPHTWNTQKNLEEYYGPCWYQKKFNIPSNWNKKIIKIRFNAVYRDVVIWINGKKVLERLGCGYTPFELRLENFLKCDSANSITLRVDNTYSLHAIPMYESFDWPNDGGIIRDVSLIASESPSIQFVKINPEYGNGKISNVNLQIFLESLGNILPRTIDVWYKINKENKTICEGNKKVNIINRQVSFGIDIPETVLWHFNNPVLYQLILAIGNNLDLSDHYSSAFGFRDFSIAGSNLYFNGEKVRLPGLEWMPGSDPSQGLAESSANAFKMLSLLKNTNSVLTRFHWQQDEKILDWCDKNGLLVQEELPLWSRPFPTDLNDSLRSIISQQINEMISNHYNHPSLIAWGIGNELRANTPEIMDFLKEIRKEVASVDSTRLINYVSNTLHSSPEFDGATVGDVMMWNDYTGLWYASGNKPKFDTDAPGILKIINNLNSNKPLIISEYGLCEPFFKGGDVRRIKHMKYHTSVYDSLDFVAGVIYFCLNDYRTHMGEEGKGTLRQRVHGIVNLIGDKKPSYDSLKTIFSPLKNVSVKSINNKIYISGKNHSGLPSYSLIGYKALLFKTNSEVSIDTIDFPVLLPGDAFNVVFKKSSPYKGTYNIKVISMNAWCIGEFKIDIN